MFSINFFTGNDNMLLWHDFWLSDAMFQCTKSFFRSGRVLRLWLWGLAMKTDRNKALLTSVRQPSHIVLTSSFLPLTDFWPKFPFYIHWKYQKTRNLLVFWSSVTWKHWSDMGLDFSSVNDVSFNYQSHKIIKHILPTNFLGAFDH